MHSKKSPPLDNFAFPNLTFFELSVMPMEELRASQLLDFLEASPRLQAVRMEIAGDILLDDVPQERIVVLPNVESLCLVVGDGGPGMGSQLTYRVLPRSIRRSPTGEALAV